jgi:hypothetical protein
MNVSWKNALLLWWSFTWRMGIFAVLLSASFGFIVMLIADEQPAICHFFGLFAWFPVSIFAIKLAVSRYAGRRQSWNNSIAFWWSLMWRLCLYAVPTGLILGIIVSIFVGRTSEHPNFQYLGWLIIFGPVAVGVFRRVIAIHSVYPATKPSLPK